MKQSYSSHVFRLVYRVIGQMERRKTRPRKRRRMPKFKRKEPRRPQSEHPDQLCFDFQHEPKIPLAMDNGDFHEVLRQPANSPLLGDRNSNRRVVSSWSPFELARKTAVARSTPVGVISLGPTGRRAAHHLLLAEAGLEPEWLRRKPWPMWFYERIIQAADRLKHSPLFLEHAAKPSLRAVVLRIRRLHRVHGVRVIHIAEAQRLDANCQNRSTHSALARRLCELSKELGVPILMFGAIEG